MSNFYTATTHVINLEYKQRITIPKTAYQLLEYLQQSIHQTNPLNLEIALSAWLCIGQIQDDDFAENILDILSQIAYCKPARLRFLFGREIAAVLLHPTFQHWHLHQSPTRDTSPELIPFQKLLECFKTQLMQNRQLPLLSLPTHAPAFIDASILIQRLLAYQNTILKYDIHDLALAICRMPRQNLDVARLLVPLLQDEKLHYLFNLIFDLPELTPELLEADWLYQLFGEEQIQWRGLWMTAICTHYPDIQMHIEPHSQTHTAYLERLKTESANKNIMIFAGHPAPDSFIYSRLLGNPQEKTLTHYVSFAIDEWHARQLTPLNQYANDLRYCAHDYLFNENNEESSLFLDALKQLDYPFNMFSWMMLAIKLMHEKRHKRLEAIHIFKYIILQEKLQHQAFAEQCSLLIQHQFAPISRLTSTFTLLKEQVKSASNDIAVILHFIMISLNIDSTLPIRFKALFELYVSMIVDKHHYLHQSDFEQLHKYSQFSSLKPLLNKLKAHLIEDKLDA